MFAEILHLFCTSTHLVIVYYFISYYLATKFGLDKPKPPRKFHKRWDIVVFVVLETADVEADTVGQQEGNMGQDDQLSSE